MPLDEATLSTFPEEIRGHEALANFNDIGSLAKSYIEDKQTYAGAIRLPDEKATPEDSKKWWSEVSPKLAERGFIDKIPEKPEAYEFKFEGVKDEVVKSDALLAKFRPIAHELGLSNAKAQALVERFAKDLLPDLMVKPPEFIEGEGVTKLLQSKFAGETQKRIEGMKSAINTLKAEYPELTDLIKDSVTFMDGKAISFWDHPVIVEFFSDVGEKMAQDSAGHIQGNGGISNELIDAELKTFTEDSNHANYAAYRQNQPEAIQRVAALRTLRGEVKQDAATVLYGPTGVKKKAS